MIAIRRFALATASVIAALAVAVPASAQGGSSASPLSWVDDASLLTPGSAAFTVSVMRWSGSGVSEVYAPIFDAAFGLTKRVQLSATIPHVVGSADGTGPVGGWGTSYFSGKVALLDDSDGLQVKVAVSPLLEVLSEAAVQSLPAGESRYQVGLPVSIEATRGTVRVFAAAGLFSRGSWFAGGGVGFPLTPRMGASMSLTRSWAQTEIEGFHRDRSEISGGVYYFVTPQIAGYGSIGHTIATAEENGAGLSLGAGVTFLLAPPQRSTGKSSQRR